MKKLFVVFVLILLSLPLIVSQEYYADLEFRLDEKGAAFITGNTNFNSLDVEKTEYLTSKKGPYWLFNLSTKESFSDYFISVEFPKNTEINYIKVNGQFRIVEDPTLRIIAIGKDAPIEIAVQYVILKSTSINYSLLIISLLSFAIIILLLLFFKKNKTSKKEKKEQQSQSVINEDKLRIIKHTLTENQKLILDILQQAKEPITQKQLQHRSNLPKATLSRNLELLKQKNIIQKQSRGMVNVIFLNENFKK